MKPTKPEDVFRAEKERALSFRNSQHARLLAEAKAAFDKLMAEGQAARKSGRPRKHPLPPLKTASSRTPPRPTPPPVVKAATPAAAPAPAPTIAPKAAKPAPAKHGATHASGKKSAPAKAKRKAKPAKKR